MFIFAFSADRRRAIVNMIPPYRWLILAVPAAIIAAFVIADNLAWAQDACVNLEVDQDGSTVPGAATDLTLFFEPSDCEPGGLTGDFTITLHRDITLPSGFDEDDVLIRAGGRFRPVWADPGRDDDDNHEIELPGCQSWEFGDTVGVCDRASFPISIELEDVQLPNRPSDSREGYEISIQWEDETRFTATIDVDAALEVDGDDEVAYGETVTFNGSGFGEGLTVRLHTIQASGSRACNTPPAPAGTRSAPPQWAAMAASARKLRLRPTCSVPLASISFAPRTAAASSMSMRSPLT